MENVEKSSTSILAALMLMFLEFSLGASQTSLNNIQDTAMLYLADAPRDSTTYQKLKWLWSVAVSIEFFVSAASGIMFKLLADNYGRKNTLIIAGIPFACSFLIQYLVYPTKSIYLLILGRIFMGFTFPALYYSVSVFIVEILPKDKLGKWGFLCGMFFALGLTCENVLGTQQILNRDNLWQFLLPLVSCFAVPSFVIMFFLPDTPPYLGIQNENLESVMKSKKFYGLPYDDDDDVDKKLLTAEEPLSLYSFISNSDFRYHKMFILASAACASYGAAPTFVYYMTDFLVQYGIDFSKCPVISSVIMGGSAFTALILSRVVQRCGRRGVYSCLLFSSIASMSVLLCFRRIGNISPTFEIVFIASLAISFAINLSIYSMSFIIGEILPDKARTSGYAMYIIIINTQGGINTQFFNVLEERMRGLGVLILLCFLIISTTFFLVLLPETKILTNEEASVEVRNRGEKLVRTLFCKSANGDVNNDYIEKLDC